MALHRSIRWLVALAAGLALIVPAATAQAKAAPVAHAAGGDAVPLDPPIVGVPITRTANALDAAVAAVDAGQGAQAVAPITAARRYMLRSYAGAKYLIANTPAPVADDARASTAKFVKLARKAVRAQRRAVKSRHPWLKARKSDDPTGPVFADTPTAVFDVLTSQFNAATSAVGLAPDTTGTLGSRVTTAYNTAIILRNRLVKVIHAAAPAAPVEDFRITARSADDEPATFDVLMPGLAVLIDAELQQMQATSADTTISAADKAGLTKAIAADRQIEALVNQWWPPAVDD